MSRAFQIRRGDVHLWTNHAAAVDQLFDFEIGKGATLPVVRIVVTPSAR
jgi:hypothetical protein